MRLSPRWSAILFPCLGQRVIDNRSWQGRHFPLISWFYYASAAWIAPRLIALVFLGFVPTISMLFFGGRPAAVFLCYAIVAIIVAGFAGGWFMRPRIEVKAHLPLRVEAGSDFIIRYEVTNRGQLPACDVALESLPFPYLLELRTRPAWLGYLRPGEQATVSGGGRALKRGRYRLQPFRWDTDFPLGLWRWGHTDWSDRTMNVYPAHAVLQSIDLPSGAHHRRETHAASHLTREALEFHGCREFRSGDLVRHIHPRSSARLGFPVVKEFKAEGRGRTALAIDTWRRHRWVGNDLMRDPVVEASLSLAASVVDHLARTDRVLELLIAGPGLYQFESAGRSGFVDEVMDILAAVEPSREDPLPSWSSLLLEEIREIQNVILFLSRWDQRRASLVRDLQDAGVGLSVYMLYFRDYLAALDIPSDVHAIDARAVLRGEVATL